MFDVHHADAGRFDGAVEFQIRQQACRRIDLYRHERRVAFEIEAIGADCRIRLASDDTLDFDKDTVSTYIKILYESANELKQIASKLQEIVDKRKRTATIREIESLVSAIDNIYDVLDMLDDAE